MGEKYRTGLYVVIIGIFLSLFSFIFMTILVLMANSNPFDTMTLESVERLGYLLSTFFWIGLIMIIVGIILHYTHKKHSRDPKENAEKILYERFAKGEISKKELNDMKNQLE